MKNKIFILLISFCTNFSYADNQQSHQINDFESYYLKNGLKVILLPFPNEDKVGLAINIRGGSKNELPQEKGYSHILEHLSFKRSKSFNNIKEFVTQKSSQWNGVTSKDYTYYYETFKNENSNLEDFLKLESERLFNLEFTEEDLESEKQIILNELHIANSSVKNQLFDYTNKQLFNIHSYAHPTIGYQSTIKNAKIKNIKDFYLKTYQPKNVFIVVYGNFKKDSVKSKIEKHFSIQSNSNVEMEQPNEEQFLNQSSRGSIYSKEDINLSNISWNSPNFLFDPRFISARILWFSSTLEPFGHIYKKYILNESKINIKEIISIQTDIFNFLDYNPFILSVNQKNNINDQNTIDSIIEDIEDVESFSENSFNKMKMIINNEWENIENSTNSLVNNFISFERMGDWRMYFYFKEQSHNASFTEGKDFLKQYVQSNNRNVATAKPKIENTYPNINTLSYFPNNNKALKNINLDKYTFNKEFTNKHIKQIEDLLKKTQKTTYNLNNNNITIQHINEKTNGDFIYIKIDNKPRNIELDNQFKNSCVLTNNFIYYDNQRITQQDLKDKLIKLNLKFNNDFFNFYIRTPQRNIDETFDLFFELLDKPAFNPTKFEQTKNSLLQKLSSNKDNPSIATQEFIDKAFNKYSIEHILYPHNSEELIQDISKITIEDVKNCYHSYKGYPNAIITIIGDVPEETIKKQINKFLQFKPKYKYSILDDNYIKSNKEVFLENSNMHKKIGPFNKTSSFFSGQSVINLNLKSPDYHKVLFAINVFGDGPNSVLFNQIREKESSSYSIKANMITQKNSDFSKIVISGSLPLDGTESIINKIDGIWTEFTKKGITEEQLKMFKEQFNNQLLSRISDEPNILNLNSNLFKRELDINWLIELKNNVNKLTTNEVNEAIHKYLADEKIFMVYSY